MVKDSVIKPVTIQIRLAVPNAPIRIKVGNLGTSPVSWKVRARGIKSSSRVADKLAEIRPKKINGFSRMTRSNMAYKILNPSL
jgi:hypothetical protein